MKKEKEFSAAHYVGTITKDDIGSDIDFKKLHREEMDILLAKQMGAVITDKRLFRKYFRDAMLQDISNSLMLFVFGVLFGVVMVIIKLNGW